MKITRIKDDNSFQFENVEIRTPLLKDLQEVGKVVSVETNQIEFYARLISRVCTFDGQKQPPEEIAEMNLADFFELAQELGECGLQTLGNELSTSQNMET